MSGSILFDCVATEDEVPSSLTVFVRPFGFFCEVEGCDKSFVVGAIVSHRLCALKTIKKTRQDANAFDVRECWCESCGLLLMMMD